MDGEQSFLHETVCLLRGSEMPLNDDKGCCEGTEAGLAHGQDTGEGIHAGTAPSLSCCSAWSNRNR